MATENNAAIWKNVCDQIKCYENIDNKQADAFLYGLEPQAFADGYIMLTAHSSFIKEWVESHYLNIIKQALEDIYQTPFEVALEVDTTQTAIKPQAEEGFLNIPPLSDRPEHPQENINSQNPVLTPSTNPLSDYTFENYVVGDSNRIAYSNALNVAENPGKSLLNPLYIYGRSGIGKTHLLRAIQYYVGINYPQMRTVYVDALSLINDYADAGRRGPDGYLNFKQQYSTADMLLIDDMQSIARGAETQNIVFEIFNNMVEHGRQVVIASDRAPQNIGIDERLSSRFASGTISDIQAPEIETKLGIIRKFADECREKNNFDLFLDDEVQNYIAYNSGSNIRELKSAIIRLMSEAQIKEISSFTVDEVADILKDHFSGGSMKRYTIPEIQRAVENFYSIPHIELVGKSRKGPIIYARQVAMYLCRNMMDISFSAIGEGFGKDHATVMHSVNVIEAKLKENRDLFEELETIRKNILE